MSPPVREIRSGFCTVAAWIKVKVGLKTIECVFIGCAHNSNAYRFLVHKSEVTDIHVNTIIESRDASFFENIFPYNIVYESIDNNKRSRDTISRSDPMEDEPRRSKRQRTSTSFGPDFLTYLLENEPRTFKEAVTSPEAPFWKEAINSEVESILSNHTWKLVDLPPGNKPLQCKWIFMRKMKAGCIISIFLRVVPNIFLLPNLRLRRPFSHPFDGFQAYTPLL